jgi:hypothetical protein
MRIRFLIMFLILGILTGQAFAMSPKKINIPKDQPGYKALEEARIRGGQKMYREMATKLRENYNKMEVDAITEEDIKTLKEIDKAIGPLVGNKNCCRKSGNESRCKEGQGLCHHGTDAITGKLKCNPGSTPCY